MISPRIECLEPRRLLALAQGGEFRVNTFTTDTQDSADVAMDNEGNFVVTWRGSAQDGSNTGIFAQRYNYAGVPQGAEFQVNTYTTSRQELPVIAMDDDGDFVIAWRRADVNGFSTSIFAQRYNSAGVRLGSEFQVNWVTAGVQTDPVIAMDASGDFVIAWISNGHPGGFNGLYAQRFSSFGAAQGSEFQLNLSTAPNASEPALAMDAEGNFIAAWQSQDENSAPLGFIARRFDSDAAALGSEFLIASNAGSVTRGPEIAMTPGGRFIVTYTALKDAGGQNLGVYARRFDSDGTALGSEFRVNTSTPVDQVDPDVEIADDGEFVITWESTFPAKDGKDIFAQQYTSDGFRQGGEFQVNTYTRLNQRKPAIAMDSDGDFVITWRSQSQDGSNYGTYAQRYENDFARLDGGLLRVEGTSGNDTISWQLESSMLVVRRNGIALSFADANVTSIEVYASDGDDTVTIGAGVRGTYVLGGNGNDTLTGASGNDALVGAAGRDRLDGKGGDDRVAGGKHADILSGGDGNDRVYGDEAGDSIDGGAGADRAYGGSENDTMLGGNQNDTLYGESGNDSIRGGNQNDRIFPGEGADSANGDAGNDNIFAADGNIDRLIGGSGSDGHESDDDDLISQFELAL